MRFIVNLSDRLDTGLFLDHRNTRARVREESGGKRVLNLFAYTGSFTVAAATGGARRTTSVDLSATYLDWAGRNLALNGGPRRRARARPGRLPALARTRRVASGISWCSTHRPTPPARGCAATSTCSETSHRLLGACAGPSRPGRSAVLLDQLQGIPARAGGPAGPHRGADPAEPSAGLPPARHPPLLAHRESLNHATAEPPAPSASTAAPRPTPPAAAATAAVGRSGRDAADRPLDPSRHRALAVGPPVDLPGGSAARSARSPAARWSGWWTRAAGSWGRRSTHRPRRSRSAGCRSRTWQSAPSCSPHASPRPTRSAARSTRERARTGSCTARPICSPGWSWTDTATCSRSSSWSRPPNLAASSSPTSWWPTSSLPG